MAEYVNNAIQEVEVGQNVLLLDSIPCTKGYVIHRNGSGILTLRGITNGCCNQFARYQVEFGGNIAVPTGGTVGEISLALAINGEPIQTSRARVTPAAVENYFNVTSLANITVPKGCCFTLSVENTSEGAIEVQNSNLTINRTA